MSDRAEIVYVDGVSALQTRVSTGGRDDGVNMYVNA